jgi:hypothetical protein
LPPPIDQPIDQPAGQPIPEVRRNDIRWDVAAIVILSLATLYFHRAMLGEDPTRMVAVSHKPEKVNEPGAYPGNKLVEMDFRFVVWLLSRNARTLATRPWDIQQAEQCYPGKNTLALGEPAITQGVFGIPGYLLWRDPIATYNFIWLALPLFSALVMFLIVKAWTASPPAGICAALLYAFHPLKVSDPVHFYVYDTVWTVLALFFAHRLFAAPRWRWAIALSLATAMQLSGSIYPILAATVAGLTFLAWLLWQYGWREQRLSHWLFISGFMAITVYLLFSPYIGNLDEGKMWIRHVQAFRSLSFLLPDQEGFPGLFTLALIVAAFVLPRTSGLPGLGRGARYLILLCLVATWWLSIGGIEGDWVVVDPRAPESDFPNPYFLLAEWIPGLAIIRGPAAIFSSGVTWLAVLAGVGTAALLRRLPTRWTVPAAALILVLAFVDVMKPPVLGLSPGFEFTPFDIRPSEESIAFYEALAEKGNDGPLLQVPVTPRALFRVTAVLLESAYHERPVGQCYNSYLSPEVEHLKVLGDRAPEASALDELREMGFTTLVLTHPLLQANGSGRLAEFEAAASGHDARLSVVHGAGHRTAYAILPAD